MNRQLKSLLSSIGILVILLSACAAQPAQGQKLIEAVAKLTNGEQSESLINSAGNTNDGVAVESNQVSMEINSLKESETLNSNLGATNPKSAAQSKAETIVDGGTSVESSQASQPGAVLEEPNSGVSSEGIPSLEERDALLDRVNLSPPIIDNSHTPVLISGPAPGTESGPVELEKPVAPLTISDNPGPGFDSSSGGISWSLQAFSDWLSALLGSIFRQ